MNPHEVVKALCRRQSAVVSHVDGRIEVQEIAVLVKFLLNEPSTSCRPTWFRSSPPLPSKLIIQGMKRLVVTPLITDVVVP